MALTCQPAISSHSLGRASVHQLPAKLDEAAKYGFDIELFYEDLAYIAKEFPSSDDRPHNLIAAARSIRSMCADRGLSIMCLQPFMHYEGLRDRTQHVARVAEMRLWIQLAHELDTDLIAIPSSFLSTAEITDDMDVIVADLREIADLGAPEGMRFAYESLAWGTYADTWEKAWAIVERVDRPNFGICIDTFNFAARTYADPTAVSGKNIDAHAAMRASIKRMIADVTLDKLFYVQVVDAERLAAPLVEGHEFYDAAQPARMSWSRNCRLFYGEEHLGAYLPIHEVLQALLVDMGFQGYISAEMFNRSLFDARSVTPAEHARRAHVSWKKLVADFEPYLWSYERADSVVVDGKTPPSHNILTAS